MFTAMSDRTTIDLLQGTLGVLILKALSWGPKHGYGIARWIEETAGDALPIEEGSLYPALHRLQARGLLTSEWTLSETNRRVKSYTITEQGRAQLRAELSRWTNFSASISRVLQARRPRT
jgi:PadR family transcriptional regulator PadR